MNPATENATAACGVITAVALNGMDGVMMTHDDCPCNDCGMWEMCDGWEAQFCCTRCAWMFDGNTPCDICDQMDI